MTTIDYGPDVADLRTRLAGAHTEIGRLQDECLRIAEERDAIAQPAKVGAAVLGVLVDFGWTHATVREVVEDDTYAESVVGCLLLAIERAIRPDDFIPNHAKGGE